VSKLSFRQLDVANHLIWSAGGSRALNLAFDLVFSFYILHFIVQAGTSGDTFTCNRKVSGSYHL